MDIRKSIKIACAKKDISQKELAVISGLSETAISQLINGRRQFTQQSLGRLCEAFDLKSSEFIALGED